MQSKTLVKHLFLTFAALPGIAVVADPAAIRFSAPVIGWASASDGSHITEIAGITESPRAGRVLTLPSAVRRVWASPDAKAVLVRLDAGLFLLRPHEPIELVAEIPPDSEVAAAWDRSSAGFAICWAEICQSRAANGAIREQWNVSAGSRLIAFSVDAGLVTAIGARGEWRGGAAVFQFDAAPEIAAFRAGTQELWSLDGTGHLAGHDRQGRRVGEGELIPDALGLVSSIDGKFFFCANAEGAAAVFSLDSYETDRFSLPDTVEGIWPVAGRFAIRLHESAKRPIAIWDGETGITGWMPASGGEVRP